MAKLVSGVYGEALYEVAVSSGSSDDIYSEVQAVREILDANPDFGKLMLHPSVPKEEKDLRDLWIDDILQIVSDNMSEGKMENEAFVLKHDDDYAGILWMGISKDQYTCDDIGYLLGLFVEESLRRKGFGRDLVRSAEEWCRSKGLLSMSLNVGSVNSNALALYESMGYKSQSIVMRRFLK